MDNEISLKEMAIKAGLAFVFVAGIGYIALRSDTKPNTLNESSDDTRRFSDQQSNDESPLDQPAIEQSLETDSASNEAKPTQETIPAFTAGYITRDKPRSRFKIVPDPIGLNRVCVMKTNESPSNTVVGMTVVVAGDPNKYDGRGTIYDGNSNKIGTWDSKIKLIGFEDLSSPAYFDAVACEDKLE